MAREVLFDGSEREKERKLQDHWALKY